MIPYVDEWMGTSYYGTSKFVIHSQVIYW